MGCFMMSEEEIQAIVNKRLAEREDFLEKFSNRICVSIEKMVASHFKNVMGVDIHNQMSVNKFNLLIKNMFSFDKKANQVKATVRTRIATRATDAILIVLILGAFEYFRN